MSIMYDITIIGAGIAGLSATDIITRESNLAIALVEGNTIGFNNPSPLTFTDIIEKNDLIDCIKGCYSSFTFHNYQGSDITFSFKKEPLVVLDYKKACDKLFATINQSKNAVEFVNKYAIGISQDDNCVIITLKDHTQLHTKILIDCSGNSQFIATQLKKHRFSYYSCVYGGLFSGVQYNKNKPCCFLWPHSEFGLGGGWFYTLADGKVSFGYADIKNSSTIDHTQLKQNFYKALEKFEPYSDYLRDATLESIENGIIPISYVQKFVYDNIIVVGDAAGMATNWTCMGIEPAIIYGKLAGKLSIKALRHSDYNILNQFQNLWEKDNKVIFDLFAKHASKFWISDYHFWEWIIKNDLVYLSPQQVIDRMRKNEHLVKKHQIYVRALIHKLRSIVNNNIVKPRSFIINN